ncbi:MAG: serine protease [Halioglobus sp.]
MKCTRVSVILFAQLCLLLPSPGGAVDLPELIQRIRPGVVGVGTAYPPRQPVIKGQRAVYLATGFVVGNGLQVVTNAHVTAVPLDVENHQTLAIFSGHGATATVHEVRSVRRDEEHDLAILEIAGPELPALTLGNSDLVREGQDIAFTGFPIGMALGLYPVTHRGIVSAITPAAQPTVDARELSSKKISRMRNGFDAFQLDATAYPGNSGSPLFELERGQVVGVINSVVVKETRESMFVSPSGCLRSAAKYIRRCLRIIEGAPINGG